MTTPTDDPRPAGWYPDPFERRPFRWWDGGRWTEYAGAETVEWDPPMAEAAAPLPAPVRAGLAEPVAGFVVGAVASLVLLRTVVDDRSVAVQMATSALALWAGLLGGCAVAWRRAADPGVGFRITWGDVGYGLAGALAGRALAGVAMSPIPFPDQRLRDLDGQGPALAGAAGWIVLVLVTCVGAPLVEEIFFRGLVQRRLVGRFGPVPGIAVASVLFGAAHLIGWDGPLSLANAWAIAASGIVLGALYHLTGRLGASIAAHMWFNAQAMVVLALLR